MSAQGIDTEVRTYSKLQNDLAGRIVQGRTTGDNIREIMLKNFELNGRGFEGVKIYFYGTNVYPRDREHFRELIPDRPNGFPAEKRLDSIAIYERASGWWVPRTVITPDGLEYSIEFGRDDVMA
ncbi:hypothetical protein KY345_02830 [Candidatus Woesearchaeota archaeon]|nr:hypothetical protein [Candidatus Woesearchaeota archaeon]